MLKPGFRLSGAVRAVTMVCVTLTASALPWGKSSPKLDPRDAAFAPVAVAPLTTGVQWGVPLKDGPVHVLLIAPRFALRDAAELAHRLEMRIETVPLWDATHFGRPDTYPRDIPGTQGDAVSSALRDGLDEKPDVIIAANFDFAVLPPEDFAAIADKVRAGTGLVLAHHRHTLPDMLKNFLNELTPDVSGAIVTRGVGESLTAEWQSGLGFVQCGTIGEGRVVELDYQGEWPLTHCLIPALTNPLLAEPEDFDTYLSLAARATRWAAGRDVATTVARVSARPTPQPEAAQIPPGLEDMAEANLPKGASMIHPYQLTLSAPADRTYTVRTGVRQRGRGQPEVTITWARHPLRKGQQAYDFYVVAGAGDYWLDVWLLDGQTVVEWSSEVIRVDAWPSIADLALSKPSVLPQDSVGVTFTMPASKRPCIAYARAVDSFGRMVAERHEPVAADTAVVKIGLGFQDLLADSLKVEVFVSDRDMPVMPDWDKRIAAYAYKYLPVRMTSVTDRLDVVATTTGSVEFNARPGYRGLLQAGFTAAIFPATDESMRLVAVLGLHALPEVTSYPPYQVSPATVRAPCLDDPNFISSEQAHVKTMAQIVRDYSTSAVSLGTANALSMSGEDVCRGPYCLAAFGEYLRRDYLSLDAMNRAWGSSRDSWDNITPPSEDEARASKRYAPWVDFRLFMDSVFLKTHDAARSVVHAADMRARSGVVARGGDELFTGYDWPALASRLDMIATPADPRTAEIVRSSRAPSAIAGIIVPDNATPEWLRWAPWFAVLHRARQVVWPDVLASTTNVPHIVGFGPLGNPVPFAPEFFAETRALESGLARLLLDSTSVPSGIAIYSSRPSAWLNAIDNDFGASSAEAERAYAAALNALGYSFDFVWRPTVEKKGLSAYRVVILPMARALSDGEVAAIRSFAASGGCVIADVAPGAFDEHGAPREAPPLAAVFGATYAGTSKATAATAALVELDIDSRRASADFASIVADGSVRPEGAAVGGLAGAAPVWLLTTGEHKALLLNHAVNEHTLDRAHGLLDEVLRGAGVQRAFDIAVRKGGEFHGQRFTASYGKAGLFALLAAPDAPEEKQKLRIGFDRKAHVYDVRAGIPQLRPAKIDIELTRGGAALFSVLPYEIASCALTAPPNSVAGARTPFHVALEAKDGRPGEHLVRIDVAAITTEAVVPLPQYSQEIVCPNGEGDGYVPFALSDAATRYRIAARDLMTGVSAVAMVDLSNARRSDIP